MNQDWASITQQIKAANDIVDVVSQVVTLRPVGLTFKGLCPFHDDKHPSFDVDPRRQRYRCWACGKYGDVFKFVEESQHVSFVEARELLAKRAGISLEKFAKKTQGPSRSAMLDVTSWAAEQFRQCLLDAPAGEVARKYIGERGLTGDTVRRFGLGFAPNLGDWLVQKAVAAKQPLDLLETVGLIARRDQGGGHFDRFRERVLFPIRDLGGQIVGFGGRILPSSSVSDRVAKYINSSETPLFSKSDQLYGIDQARQPASRAGCVAVVEGYTDVMMAHQCGVCNVVATMGTALNARHVRKLRAVTDRVILVYDSDAGGDRGVDRALEVFVSHDLDLRVATLPAGLDPCDLLLKEGPEPLRQALDRAVSVFDYKLDRVWAAEAGSGIEGKRRAVEQMLAILALAPEGQAVKVEMMVRQVASRLGFVREFQEETLWKRLRELRGARGKEDAPAARLPEAAPTEPVERSAPAARHEVRLLEVLLAHPPLVGRARATIRAEEIEHPGLRTLLEVLYRLDIEGRQPDLDHLRERLDNERLWDIADQLQQRGLGYIDGAAEFAHVLRSFRDRQVAVLKQALRERLEAGDYQAAAALQKQLKEIPEGEPFGGEPPA